MNRTPHLGLKSQAATDSGGGPMSGNKYAVIQDVVFCIALSIGALFFFLSISGFNKPNVVFGLAAAIAIFVFAMRNLYDYFATVTGKTRICLLIISASAGLGVMLFYEDSIRAHCSNAYTTLIAPPHATLSPTSLDFLSICYHCAISILLLCALVFIALAVFSLFVNLLPILQSLFRHLKDEAPYSLYFSLLVYLILLVVIIVVYTQTTAFFGPGHYNAIYEGDADLVLRIENAFISLLHNQNDIRQPLFAVFSIPFMGIPYLLSRLIPFGGDIPQAILFAGVQAAMLVVSILAISARLKTSRIGSLLFLIMCSLTFTFMLTFLMIEQYVIALFWLALLVYSAPDEKPDYLLICGAIGTLSTSCVLVPILYWNKGAKNCLMICAKSALAFGVMMIAFYRLDIFASFATQTSTMLGISSEQNQIPFGNRVNRYFAFISNLFFAPESGIYLDGTPPNTYTGWQILESNYRLRNALMGSSILVISLIGFFLCRKQAIAQTSMLWIAFSFLLLPVIGYGSMRQGYIPYLPYFFWPFCILVFNVFDKAGLAKRPNSVLSVAANTLFGILIIAMLVINCHATIEMIVQITPYYPIN